MLVYIHWEIIGTGSFVFEQIYILSEINKCQNYIIQYCLLFIKLDLVLIKYKEKMYNCVTVSMTMSMIMSITVSVSVTMSITVSMSVTMSITLSVTVTLA